MISRREQLERLPLRYDVVVFRGENVLKRTTAIGELVRVQTDVYHLALALGGTSVVYTRRAQSWPPPADDAPRWWCQGFDSLQRIDAGASYTLGVRTGPAAPDVALETVAGGGA